MQWKEVSFGGGLMTVHIGLSLHKRGCQLQFDAPPPKSLLPTYPWSASFPSRHLPSLVPGHQVSSLLHLFFCHNTVSVGMLLWLIGPVPPAVHSQSIPYGSHVHVYTPGGGLSHGGLIAANGGGDEGNQEPRPSSEHQIMWTVPGNWGLGGIIGVCYFRQMKWLVSFLVFSQLSDHVHNCLVWSLYQTIHMGVVGHGPQSFDTKDLAQFPNYATGKASTSVT